MAKKDNDYFLIYPDLNEVCSSSESLPIAISRFLTETKRIKEEVDINSKWKSEKDKKLAKSLYSSMIGIYERYNSAYEDMLRHEQPENGEVQLIFPFSKGLAREFHIYKPERMFKFYSRLKSFESLVNKIVSNAETRDVHNLETIYDIQAGTFVLLGNKDEDKDRISLYYMVNDFLQFVVSNKKILTDKKVKYHIEIAEPKKTEEASERIMKQYRNKVKDYVEHPKKRNGYQAIQLAIKISFEINDGKKINKLTKYFDMHFKTYWMDLMAQDGAPWGHSDHKLNVNIEMPWKDLKLEEIHYPDFFAIKSEDGKCFFKDDAGLILPKELTRTIIYRT